MIERPDAGENGLCKLIEANAVSRPHSTEQGAPVRREYFSARRLKNFVGQRYRLLLPYARERQTRECRKSSATDRG